ncbi:MAG TPA: 5-deoxy-glucuronate isomerase [Candidatus Dormibacteraeota bacterium]|nr:5-deoxy-glucuronate isomerase [Candidatus Dormibacteraeota bacterium]
MSSLLVRPHPTPDAEKRILAVTPQRAQWRHVGFEVVHLEAGDAWRRETGERETCLVWLSGSCNVETEGMRWRDMGGRRDVFDGPPQALYVPPRSWLKLVANASSEIAVGSAPASTGAKARRLQQARVEIRGSGASERKIHHILMEDEAAEALLVTEVLTPGGHWSSYPPHKHDENDPPRETQLEETYYHRLRDARGFAVQRVYTADRSLDESIAVRDGDLVLVPRGYHTVSAPPGYDLYYLNVMAGPVRRWCVTFDPEHERLR